MSGLRTYLLADRSIPTRRTAAQPGVEPLNEDPDPVSTPSPGATLVSKISAPPLEDQLLEVYRGKVERIDGTTAYVTLVDSQEQAFLSACPTAKLQEKGIGEGMRFTLKVVERAGIAFVAFDSVPLRELSDTEWQQVRQKTEETLRDFPDGDDY